MTDLLRLTFNDKWSAKSHIDDLVIAPVCSKSHRCNVGMYYRATNRRRVQECMIQGSRNGCVGVVDLQICIDLINGQKNKHIAWQVLALCSSFDWPTPLGLCFSRSVHDLSTPKAVIQVSPNKSDVAGHNGLGLQASVSWMQIARGPTCLYLPHRCLFLYL